MAARFNFLTLRRNVSTGRRVLLRFLSSKGEVVYEERSGGADEIGIKAEERIQNDDLKSRIFRLRLPKRSVADVLHSWVSEGRQITMSDLRDISKDLRKLQRYKHALEISEWMIAHSEVELSDYEYGIRIDLIAKVFGVYVAERYFDGLSPSLKTTETYTALLHSYAVIKEVEKAEELFETMKKENLSMTALTYNELMNLYISVGQLEKVLVIIEELKSQKVAPDLFTYSLWITSCAATFNIDEVRRILDEMILDCGFSESWLRYANLVKVYITSGLFSESDFASPVKNDKNIITQREWITHDFLIMLYGGMGNKEIIDQIWKSLSMSKQKMINRNYACVVSSYLMLEELKEVRDIIDQWKQSTTADLTTSSCNQLLKAFVEVGLTDRADALRMILMEKGCDNLDNTFQQ